MNFPNDNFIKKLFDSFDENNDGEISLSDTKRLINLLEIPLDILDIPDKTSYKYDDVKNLIDDYVKNSNIELSNKYLKKIIKSKNQNLSQLDHVLNFKQKFNSHELEKELDDLKII